MTASHRLRKSQDVVVHGLLRAGKCYTHGLIPPILEADHPKASSLNSIELAKLEDPEFAEECRRATIYYIYMHQETKYESLRRELEKTPDEFHTLPSMNTFKNVHQ